jgi:hypothetical protein
MLRFTLARKWYRSRVSGGCGKVLTKPWSGGMNQILNDAIKAAERLSEDDQEELGRALMRMALRKEIDADLARAEARGGRTPHAAFMAELKERYG